VVIYLLARAALHEECSKFIWLENYCQSITIKLDRMPEITPWARERIELDRVLAGNRNGQ